MTDRDIGNIAAVLVTCNPDVRVFQALDSLMPQVGHIWIVDNGSNEDTLTALKEREDGANGRITLIANSENLGLAKAQNIGIGRALDAKFDWVLLLDDDSIPGTAMVTRLLDGYERSSDKDGVGLVCPRLEDEAGSVKPRVFISSGPFHFSRRPLHKGGTINGLAFAIASGSLIRAAVLRDIGLMRDDFFIDYIDIEFSFRLRQAGYKILAVGDAVLNHRLGEIDTKRVMGKERNVRSHNADRRYYIYRNRIKAWRLYARHMPAYILFELAAVAIDLVKLLTAEDDKGKKFRSILRGIKDGVSS